jgi:hypothetical protein
MKLQPVVDMHGLRRVPPQILSPTSLPRIDSWMRVSMPCFGVWQNTMLTQLTPLACPFACTLVATFMHRLWEGRGCSHISFLTHFDKTQIWRAVYWQDSKSNESSGQVGRNGAGERGSGVTGVTVRVRNGPAIAPPTWRHQFNGTHILVEFPSNINSYRYRCECVLSCCNSFFTQEVALYRSPWTDAFEPHVWLPTQVHIDLRSLRRLVYQIHRRKPCASRI